MRDGKAHWRERVKKIIREISPLEFEKKGHEISDRLYGLLSSPSLLSREHLILGGYAPLKGEVDWAIKLTEFKNQMAFPDTIDGEKMAFFKSRPEELVLSSHFGRSIMTPAVCTEEVIPDILIIPGLGFTRQGHRLGRGKGFYDRYLECFKGQRWGVCLSNQIFTGIPVDQHDQMMDLIITDLEIIKTKENSPS